MRINTEKFEEKGSVKMIAHRGVSGLELENTCPAFVAAGVKSYYGIETDVHVTADGKFIVVHDDDLKRIAGLDVSVEGSTFARLREIRLKDTDGKTDRADLFLPSLEEYVSICKKYEKVAVLELKNRMKKEEIFKIAETIKDIGWLDKTIFISFEGDNLVDLRSGYPRVSAQFLAEKGTEKEFDFMVKHKLDADLWFGCLTKSYVEKLHSAGIKVNCWTVDRLEDARRMQEYGVDFITSNILE